MPMLKDLQSWGLGVWSSNLPAPTNQIKDLENVACILGTR